MYDGNPGEIDFGSSFRDVRVCELSEVNCIKGDSLLAEVSHEEAKMRERGETSPFSHFCLVVRDLC